MDAQAGDRVLVKTKNKQYEGTFLPTPELLDQSTLVVKLDSGYNMGIDKKKIVETKVLKKYKSPKIAASNLKKNTNLPTIAILTCGGTIASRLDYKTGGVISSFDDHGVTNIDSNDFSKTYPELNEIANIKIVNVLNTMSEDFDTSSYTTIAKALQKELLNKSVSGIVVTQGTDTLHYSTAFLSFMIQNPSKPIVFTAAQRSTDRGSSDAFMNLQCAVYAAKSGLCNHIVTCMHGSISDDYCLLIRGTKVRKMHTSRRDAFRPVNDVPLGKVWPSGKIEYTHHAENENAHLSVQTNLEKKVGILHIHPGISPKLVDFFIKEKYKGLVISATALGHVPTNSKDSLIPVLTKAVKSGMTVVVASQTLYGRVNPNVYSNLRQVSIKAGCLYAEDMMPEVAFAKLSWVLGNTKDKDKIKELFTTNIAGEINTSLTEKMFLN